MGVNKDLGPDNEESPHKLASPQNIDYPATADIIRSTAGLEFLGKLPPSIPRGRFALPQNLGCSLQRSKSKTWTWQF